MVKSKYRPEFVEQAKSLCEQFGATDDDLADFFKVKVRTIHRWKALHPDFIAALTVGKEIADNRVERSLYMNATGFRKPALKIFQYEGNVIKEKYEEHVSPDTRAAIFWLCNRRRDRWNNQHMKGIGFGADDEIPASLKVEIVDGRRAESDPATG
jgi:hypothetical protein